MPDFQEKIKKHTLIRGNKYLLYITLFLLIVFFIVLRFSLDSSKVSNPKLLEQSLQYQEQQQTDSTDEPMLVQAAIISKEERDERLQQMEKEREERMKKEKNQERITQELEDRLEDLETADIDVENFGEKIYRHRTEEGETLPYLAERFNVLEGILKKTNDLKSSEPPAGTVLEIPVRAMHQVKTGDTFTKLAKRYLVERKLIQRANMLDDGELKVGDVIIIPQP